MHLQKIFFLAMPGVSVRSDRYPFHLHGTKSSTLLIL